MKKIIFPILLLLLTGCSLSSTETWQGTYYPNGEMFNEEYSPIFGTFGECKSWVLEMKRSSYDKYTCGQNCEFQDRNTVLCDLVVRSWSPLPGSPMFGDYK